MTEPALRCATVGSRLPNEPLADNDDAVKETPKTQDAVVSLKKICRLVSCNHEKSEMLKHYKRIVTSDDDNAREIVLITGPSGTGKTSLARLLKEHVQSHDGGYFVSGKFDQFQRYGQPYSPFVSAFTDFVKTVVNQGEDEVMEMKSRINKSVGPDDHLLLHTLPALEQILGVSSKEKTLSMGIEAHGQFKKVFRRFIQAICSPETPLVLFLDDLQWADMACLDLLKTLARDLEAKGFVLLGACRGNEISIYDPLAALLRELEDEGVVINDILLSNLDEKAVNEFVAESLSISEERSKHLALVLYQQTDGNMFFVMQYLRYLWESKILRNKPESGWTWDEERIEETGRMLDVVGLITERIRKLPQGAQKLLQVASCVGAEFDGQRLYDVLDDEISDVPAILALAQSEGLLIVNTADGEICRFAHDRIQQASYALIPPSERPAFHLDIGRKLWENLSEEDLALNVFLVVDQLNLGIDLMADEEERNRVAGLCLHAGERATQSSAFVAASQYLTLGISLLGSRHWRDEYDLSLALFNASAEVEYCNANFQKMEHVINDVLMNARSLPDMMRAYTTQVNALGARNNVAEAINTAFTVLKRLGQPFPAKARVIYIVSELMKTKKMLKGYTNDDILNLPIMEDADQLAAVRMMNILFPYTFSCQPEFAPLVTFRLVQTSLRNGICAMTSSTFAMYAMFLCIAFGDVDEGYRYGELSLRLLDKFGSEQWIPRVYVAVHGMVNTWKKPLRQSLDHMRTAHLLGMGSGDIEFAMLAAALSGTLSFYSGRALIPLVEEMEGFRQLMIEYKQDHILNMHVPNMQAVLNFLGRSKDPLVLTGEVVNQEEALSHAVETKNRTVVAAFMTNCMMLACYLNKYQQSHELFRTMRQDKSSSFGYSQRVFMGSITYLALAKSSRRHWRVRKARKFLHELKKLEQKSLCSQTHRVDLVEAELAALRGDLDEALEKYRSSIEHANKLDSIYEEALACEKAGAALNAAGHATEGTNFLRRALLLYDEWGGKVKVDQMKRRLGLQ